MGIFYFACSFAPGMLKSMLELIGFVANRDLGLQYFRAVYDNAGLRGIALPISIFSVFL